MKKKQRLLSLALCAALVLLSACQSAPAPSSAPEPPPAPPSQESPAPEPPSSESQPPVYVLPEDTTQLTVPLQMTEPWGDVYPSGDLEYTTQAEVDACRRWLCDLKAGDITALYGVTIPLDHYWTGEMSPEDSRKVTDLLRSIAPDLAPLEGGNPPTGGGWYVAVHTGGDAATLGFNGEWVTFHYDGKGYIFDGTAPSVLESCGSIDALLSKYASMEPPPEETATVDEPAPAPEQRQRYFPEEVRSVYAVDVNAYTMAQVDEYEHHSRNIWKYLEERTPSEDGKPSGYAYLIFTDEGKEYVYLDDSREDSSLVSDCKWALNNSPLHPSWLIHMTPERMVSAYGDIFEGTAQFSTQEELLALAKFLKTEMTVKPYTSVHSGATNHDTPAGLINMKITFDSGVEYYIGGYDTGFSIYTTDLDTAVYYTVDEDFDAKLRAFLKKYL